MRSMTHCDRHEYKELLLLLQTVARTVKLKIRFSIMLQLLQVKAL